MLSWLKSRRIASEPRRKTAQGASRVRALTLESLEKREVMTTFFVANSGNDGGAGNSLSVPFRTVQHALDVATHAGDVVAVRAGVYNEKLSFTASGTAAAPIILKGYASERPILDGAGKTFANSGLISIADRSNVQVVGFELRNITGANDGSAIRVEGAGTGIVIRGNKIHDIRGTNAIGISVLGSSTTAPIGTLTVSDNEIYNSQPSPSAALQLAGNVANFYVVRNSVHDVNDVGIALIGGPSYLNANSSLVPRSGYVQANTVARAKALTDGGYAAGIYVDGARNLYVQNNSVTQSDMGIQIAASTVGVNTTGMVVQNNIVNNNFKAGIVVGGYDATVARVVNSRIINNTVAYNDSLADGSGQLAIQYASNNIVTNNIFLATANGWLLNSSAGDTSNTLDYNVWYSSANANAVSMGYHSADYASFPAYRTASGRDTHSVYARPIFVSGTFRLATGSAGIDFGSSTTGWYAPRDRNGTARPQGAAPDAGAVETVSVALTADQRRRADQLVSVFENSTTVIQYNYIENIFDGRGYTAGRVGFTTGTGDFLLVVQRFTDQMPSNPLAPYLPRLRELAALNGGAGSDSTDGLDGIVDAWHSSANNAASSATFRAAQDYIVDQLYFTPARVRWENLGLHNATSLAILFDTIIQHGEGDDYDGLPAMINRTNAAMGGSPASGVNEVAWIYKFLDVRYAVLSNAQDPATRLGWQQSRPRVDILRGILNSGNYDLHGPITNLDYYTTEDIA